MNILFKIFGCLLIMHTSLYSMTVDTKKNKRYSKKNNELYTQLLVVDDDEEGIICDRDQNSSAAAEASINTDQGQQEDEARAMAEHTKAQQYLEKALEENDSAKIAYVYFWMRARQQGKQAIAILPMTAAVIWGAIFAPFTLGVSFAAAVAFATPFSIYGACRAHSYRKYKRLAKNWLRQNKEIAINLEKTNLCMSERELAVFDPDSPENSLEKVRELICQRSSPHCASSM